jgi:recombination protein RecR
MVLPKEVITFDRNQFLTMDLSQLPSRLLENTVNEFAKLPGIGKKTALRLVLHLLNQPEKDTLQFTHTIEEMKREVKICKKCHNIAEDELCAICSNPNRDETVVCVVESIKEVIAIENTSQYKGLYHVLGGRISPMDGIGPKDLHIDSLMERIQNDPINEMILALSTTMEGDTTSFYIYRKLSDSNIILSTLARGISVGDELEYADEITLGRSLVNRIPYHGK